MSRAQKKNTENMKAIYIGKADVGEGSDNIHAVVTDKQSTFGLVIPWDPLQMPPWWDEEVLKSGQHLARVFYNATHALRVNGIQTLFGERRRVPFALCGIKGEGGLFSPGEGVCTLLYLVFPDYIPASCEKKVGSLLKSCLQEHGVDDPVSRDVVRYFEEQFFRVTEETCLMCGVAVMQPKFSGLAPMMEEYSKVLGWSVVDKPTYFKNVLTNGVTDDKGFCYKWNGVLDKVLFEQGLSRLALTDGERPPALGDQKIEHNEDTNAVLALPGVVTNYSKDLDTKGYAIVPSGEPDTCKIMEFQMVLRETYRDNPTLLDSILACDTDDEMDSDDEHDPCVRTGIQILQNMKKIVDGTVVEPMTCLTQLGQDVKVEVNEEWEVGLKEAEPEQRKAETNLKDRFELNDEEFDVFQRCLQKRTYDELLGFLEFASPSRFQVGSVKSSQEFVKDLMEYSAPLSRVAKAELIDTVKYWINKSNETTNIRDNIRHDNFKDLMKNIRSSSSSGTAAPKAQVVRMMQKIEIKKQTIKYTMLMTNVGNPCIPVGKSKKNVYKTINVANQALQNRPSLMKFRLNLTPENLFVIFRQLCIAFRECVLRGLVREIKSEMKRNFQEVVVPAAKCLGFDEAKYDTRFGDLMKLTFCITCKSDRGGALFKNGFCNAECRWQHWRYRCFKCEESIKDDLETIKCRCGEDYHNPLYKQSKMVKITGSNKCMTIIRLNDALDAYQESELSAKRARTQ